MQISYNKLLKLMIDNQMKRTDLIRAAQISTSTAAKLFKNEPFHCDIGDICEVIFDDENY